MHIESQKTTVQKSAENLFNELIQVGNYQKLMPENTAKFEIIDNETFLFALQGMPEITLRIKEKTPSSKIVLASPSDKPSFNLTALIESASEQSASVQLIFQGEFNTMMAMMIKGPITKFIETLAANMFKL
jgi:hypothetical protein